MIGIQRKLGYVPEYAFVRVNGDPGVRIDGPDGVASVLAFEIADGRVANVRVVNNPEKLDAALTPAAGSGVANDRVEQRAGEERDGREVDVLEHDHDRREVAEDRAEVGDLGHVEAEHHRRPDPGHDDDRRSRA